MVSHNTIAVYFRRKARLAREKAATLGVSGDAKLHRELADLYDKRAADAERRAL